jgi:hypothetical protein
MRTPLTRTAAGAVGALVMMWLVLPMTAAAATAKNVPNGEEAWFLAKKEFLAEPTGEDPTCGLPTGCNVSGTAQRQNNHPEGVMVVAANAGDPDAQTFFNFDSAGLPFGAVITGGTVTLPVARDPDAGNVRADAAQMVACAVEGFIPGGTDAGSYRDRPTIQDNLCVDVKLTGDDPTALVYTVDLERIGKAWSEGKVPQNGITLMVDPSIEVPAPDQTWRVAFNTQRRSAQKIEEEKKKPEESRIAYPAITSTLEYRVEKLPEIDIPSGGTETGGGSPGVFPPSDTGTSGGGGDFGGGSTAPSGDSGSAGFGSSGAPATGGSAPTSDSGVAPVDQPIAAGAPAAEAPVAAGATTPVSAPGTSKAVWVMPLLALAMAGAMAWSLMQPVELAGAREGAVSKLMRTRRLNAQNPS